MKGLWLVKRQMFNATLMRNADGLVNDGHFPATLNMRNICTENIIINNLNEVAHATRATSASFTSSPGRLHSKEESTAPDRR